MLRVELTILVEYKVTNGGARNLYSSFPFMTTNEPLKFDMRSIRERINVLTNFIYKLYLLININMVTMQNFKLISDRFNVLGVFNKGN
jgi:hypothetical protein